MVITNYYSMTRENHSSKPLKMPPAKKKKSNTFKVNYIAGKIFPALDSAFTVRNLNAVEDTTVQFQWQY